MAIASRIDLTVGRLAHPAAVLLALVAAVGLYGAIILGSRAGPLADLTHYKHWTRLVTVEGIHTAYRGEYPDTYAIYPPVTLAPFLVAGVLYERLVDPSFALDRALGSHALSVLIRAQALAFHLLTALAVLLVARHAVAFWPAYAAMLAYLFNPGVVFDVAQWGQPDPVFGFLVLVALAAASVSPSRTKCDPAPGVKDATAPRASFLSRFRVRPVDPGATAPSVTTWYFEAGRPMVLSLSPWFASIAGASIMLAALAKPQAWVFIPLIAALIWRRGGARGVLSAGVAGVFAGAVVVLPFLLQGTLRELIGLPRQISSVMPVVTANAHNLWWFFTDGAARWYVDQDRFLGPASFRLVGVALVLALGGLAVLRALRQPTVGAAFTAGAFTGFAFFMGMTQIHENHMYVVFPLLAVAAAVDRRLWGLYAVLAGTWCANMLLHDFDLAETVVAPLLPWALEDAQWANAGANVLVLAGWTAWLAAQTFRVAPSTVSASDALLPVDAAGALPNSEPRPDQPVEPRVSGA